MKKVGFSNHEGASAGNSSENARSSSGTNRELLKKKEKNQKMYPSLFRWRKSIKIVFGGIIFALMVIIYVLANKGSSGADTDPAPIPISKDKIIEVEVVDGSGNVKVAQHMINVLRTLGYDVVEFKRNNEGIVERSYILDRSGDLNAANKLATSLGIPKDKVFQKIDRDLFLDLTVVVGKDFSRFNAFQSFTKRNKH